MVDKVRVVFAGTPEFAVPALRALAEQSGYSVVAVYTQPDRPAGRGRKTAASPVKEAALGLGISIEQPLILNTETAVQDLARHSPDVMVVAAYGLLLPQKVLDIPKHGCINIHASLLPRWRGAAPIQRSIIAGDKQTGICIMRMDAGLDTGPVYLEKRIDITPADTGGFLHDRLAVLGAQAIIEALPRIVAGTNPPDPQDSAAATYARKLQKSEALIDWTLPAGEIERRVRAFNPWPISETRLNGQQFRIWCAKAIDADADADRSAPASPGTVTATTNDGIFVACGRGSLLLEVVQLPGGRAQSSVAFLNSHSIDNVRLGF